MLVLVAVAAYGCSLLFAPRAAYLQVGAMLGTIMVANVFFVIIPAHWELIRAKEAGRDPDPAANARGKQRSVHNNYLTLPVLFAMLSNHFAFTYTHADAWLVLVWLMVIGAAIRHFFNLRHRGRNVWAIPILAAVSLAGIAIWLRPPETSAAGPAVPFSRVQSIVGRALRRVPLDASDTAGLLGAAARHRVRHAAADQVAGGRDPGAGRRPEGDAARERDAHDAGRAKRTVRVDPSGCEDPVMLNIRAGGFDFAARLEEEDAPQTVAAFRKLLPLESRIIHVRWSGEGGWIPWGDLDLGLGPENATRYPSPGELIIFPGGVSEAELLLAYGYVAFASKAGALAGNHFATIVEGKENLRELGRRMLWEGAQEIVFTER